MSLTKQHDEARYGSSYTGQDKQCPLGASDVFPSNRDYDWCVTWPLCFLSLSGIVSGLGREMQSVTGNIIRDVVQTDAGINPGEAGRYRDLTDGCHGHGP